MRELDNFISPIPGFEGDMPIPAIPITARDPGAGSSKDPSTGSSANASRTQAYKQKALIDLNPPRKPRRLLGNI
jgi:hypothetical protein